MDAATKPLHFEETCETLIELYADSSFSATNDHLKRLGVGLGTNKTPLQVSMLRYVIDRISVAYDRPPNRYLEKTATNKRIAESSKHHKAMLRVVERAQLDLAMREADRIRGLTRQAIIRYYPVDSEGAVLARVFNPCHVFRIVDPASSDRIEQDQAIAIQLAGGMHEVWWRDEEGWLMMWTVRNGEPHDVQPFGDNDFRSPYSELPISIVYDSFSSGRAWLAPRVSRIASVNAINLLSNELLELVATQAHVTRRFKTRDPNRPPPAQTGPGQTVKIHIEDELDDISPSPAIAEAKLVLQEVIRNFLLSEDLDPNELSESRAINTGAALRVQERGLMARRESQVPLAVRDERLAYRKLRAVHNHHAASWGESPLSEDHDMRAELAEIDSPTDMSTQLDVESRKIALGIGSTIDAIQALENLHRPQAIERYSRIKEDAQAYPPLSPPSPEEETAGSFSDTLNDVRVGSRQEPADSVKDAALNISAADRRAERRAN